MILPRESTHLYCREDELTMIKDCEFGKIEIVTVPLPEGMTAVNGTYTYSGRVLAANYEPDDRFHVITLNDDGTDVREIYHGKIPQVPTANGIRWMCFSDNKRVLLGDYVLEVTPDLDHPESAEVLPVEYPQELMKYPGLFRHWSEIIISPDSEHIIWTMLTFTGAANFLGRLVRGEGVYHIEDICCISSQAEVLPDPAREGYVIPQTLRGGEVKQFVHGGRAISLVGNSDCISDSVIEELDTGNTMQFSQTSGYEETAIFSPDETMAICMSPRFSLATDCSVIGMVPLPHSGFVRAGIINPAYNYAIASQRQFRMGNIGPALVDAQRTRQEGRGYSGVDLSDPENRFVYVSPMSWAPCSTKALWNEHTRASDPEKLGRLRVVMLLDKSHRILSLP